MKRKRLHRVERLEELEALSSPVRLELLGAAAALGKCTTAELAATTGRTASSLYFHLDKLVEVGLLLREEQSGGATFAVAGRRIQVSNPEDDPDFLDLMVRSAGNVMRAAARGVQRALASGQAKLGGRNADTLLTSKRAFVAPADLRELVDYVGKIEDLLDRAGRTREGKLVMFTACLAPAPSKTQKRK